MTLYVGPMYVYCIGSILYCIVLYLYIYIALLAVYTKSEALPVRETHRDVCMY